MTIREAVLRSLEHYTIEDGSNEMFFHCVDRICAEIGKEIAALEAERDALRKDAARWKWARDQYAIEEVIDSLVGEMATYEEMEAAIDAAIAQDQP